MNLGLLNRRIAPPVSVLPVRVCGAVILLCLAAAAATRLSTDIGDLAERTPVYVAWTLAAGVAFTAASWLALRRPPKHIAFIVLMAFAMRAVAFIPPPLTSSDVYRYVWDGQVQNAGVNPYRYLPADPALAPLRDTDTGTGPAAIYPNINRADYAPTIYPPAAQAIFAVTTRLWPGIWGMKATMLVFDLLAAGVVLKLLDAAGHPRSRVLLYAWNPLVVLEFAGGGHIDAAAAGLSALALWAAIRLRPSWAGAALAAAILCKLLPAALVPALWRRWELRLPVACGCVMAAGYGWYSGAGWRVLGYLPGYASEEGLNSGSGFFPLRAFALLGPLPGWAGTAYMAVAAAGLLAAAGAVALRAPFPRDRAARVFVIAQGALWLSTATLVALSPHYPWYYTAVIVPSVLAPNPGVLWLTLAAPALYLDHGLGNVAMPAIVFVPFLILLARGKWRREPPAPSAERG